MWPLYSRNGFFGKSRTCFHNLYSCCNNKFREQMKIQNNNFHRISRNLSFPIVVCIFDYPFGIYKLFLHCLCWPNDKDDENLLRERLDCTYVCLFFAYNLYVCRIQYVVITYFHNLYSCCNNKFREQMKIQNNNFHRISRNLSFPPSDLQIIIPYLSKA
jgi:hypothetical protein